MRRRPSTRPRVEVLTYGGRSRHLLLLVVGRAYGFDRDIWKGRADAVPRLGVRPVRHDSPYHDWGPMTFRRRLASEAEGARSAARHPDDVQLLAARDTLSAIGAGGEVDLVGDDIRTMLGLRSTLFRSACCRSIRCPRRSSRTAARHADRYRAAPRRPELEQRTAARTLGADRAMRPTDGSNPRSVKATAPTEFRVTTGGVSTPPTTVVVAPSVTPAGPEPRPTRSRARAARDSRSVGGDPALARSRRPWTTVAACDVEHRAASGQRRRLREALPRAGRAR